MSERTASKVPQIRFKEFEAEWEETPIGKVLSEKNRPIVLRDHERYELITVKRRNEGVISRGHLFGRDILVKNYSQLQTGDFVVSKRQVVHGATGMIAPELDGAIVSNEYLVAVNSRKLLTEFLTILASLPAMRQKFFLSSYGVDIEKLFFDAEDWKKRNVTIPAVTEQTKIGEYLRQLERLIELHQRKHDKLVTLKKAMLQKMFPQPGATTPEIRFTGFTGDWESKRIDDIAPLQRGFDLPTTTVRQGPHPVVYSNGILRAHDEYKCVAPGVVTGRSGTIGKVTFVSENYWPHNTSLWVTNFFQNDPLFIYYFYVQFRLERLNAGSTIPTLNRNDVHAVRTNIPRPAEQQKIGTYFRTLDELIAKHATQLQKLQQIKAACLERMFV